MADSHNNDDFLDGSAVAPHAYDDATQPPYAAEAPAPRRRRLPAAAATAGWLVVGLVVGGVSVAAWHAAHSGTGLATPAAATGPIPGGTGGGFGGGPGAQNGFSGEQHVVGTLKAVSGSTITVTGNGGSATYTVDSSTELVKDGQQVSSLSAMHPGDTVVVHVYPLGGRTHVERVIDGVQQGDGFGPRDGGLDGSSTGSGTTTT